MNNSYEIEQILQFLAKLQYQNPNRIITVGTVYSLLKNYDLGENEVNTYIGDNFDIWMKKFKKSNLDVFYTNMQPGFLQFTTHESDAECIKIYLSFPADKIQYCVNDIFKFISDNHIKSASKVSSKIRSDSVVLRLFSKEDANLVLDYINNNRVLTSSAKKTNPFSMNDGICGIGYDGWLSYNKAISFIISEYIKELKQTNNLANASFDNFKNYVVKFYNDSYINHSNFSNLLNNYEYMSEKRDFQSNEEFINNNERITRLFSAFLNYPLTREQYFGYYDSFVNEARNLKEPVEHETIVFNNDAQNKDKIMYEYLQLAKVKYGNGMYDYINCFIKTGDYVSITRTNNMRQLFKDYFITSQDLALYIKLHPEFKQANTSVKDKEEEFDSNEYEFFIKAINATYLKYGDKQLIVAINRALSGNFDHFTNDGSNLYRQRLSSINIEKIEKYCKKLIGKNLANIQNLPPNLDLGTLCLLALRDYNSRIDKKDVNLHIK